MTYEDDITGYAQRIKKALGDFPAVDLARVANQLLEARENGRWVYLAGNGGSASSVSHFANDLVKGLSVKGKKRFRALAMCDPTPIVTALANDYDYSCIFVEQLKNYAVAGDVLLLVSGSGNSSNIIKAAEYGKEIGLTVISFTGRDGGKVKAFSDICCIAATDVMEEIEDIHAIWGHSLITTLRSSIAGE
jgi:D-sedoheptulose 7-phosphate isomerase